MAWLRTLFAEFRVRELLHGFGPSCFFAVALLLDQRFLPKTEKLRSFAYLWVFGAIGLAAVAWCGARRNVVAARLVAAFATIAVAGPLLRAWWLELGRGWVLEDPSTLLIPTALATSAAMVAVVLAGANGEEWGFGLGDWRWWVPRAAAVAGVIVPAAALATALLPSLREFYPADPDARQALGWLFVASAGKALYLLVEELFWHGIVLFSLARTHGDRAALIVTSFMYFMAHHTKPEIEMASSFPGAVLLSLACLRARTFWPAFLVHYPMNLTVDLTAFFLEGPRPP